MCAASVLLSLMGVFAKISSGAINSAPPLSGSEIAVIRYVFGIAVLLCLARLNGTNLLGTNRRMLLLRGISGGVASTAYFVGIQATSLTHATLLNSTNVVWASVFAIFMLKEPIRLPGLLSAIGALCGVMLVTNASLDTVQSGDIVSLFSGIMAGLAVVQIRRLRRTESSLAVFFYFNVAGLPIALCALWITHGRLIMPLPVQLPALLAVGLASVAGQLLMTYGYKELPAAQGSIIILTSVLLSAVLSHLLFHDPFTIGTLAGGVLILGGAVALSLSSRATRRAV